MCLRNFSIVFVCLLFSMECALANIKLHEETEVLSLDKGSSLQMLESPMEKILQEVKGLLPVKIRQELKKHKIKIGFKDFGELPIDLITNCGYSEKMNSQRFVIAKYETGKIVLHSKFIPYILGLKANLKFNCRHKFMRKTIIATILHELFHFYDSLNLPSLYFDEETKRNDCVFYDVLDQQLDSSPLCSLLGEYKHTVSDRYPFLGLSRQTSWASKNIFSKSSRTVDEYEFYSAAESLAVNFEYFLLDPEFHCRRPALNQAFERLFPSVKNRMKSCSTSYEVYINQTSIPVNLSPSRIYQIHYLLADKGSAIESKFGHGMFRLIVCAPERKILSEKCLEDTQYHIVAGFLSDNINDSNTDHLGGLTGKYSMSLQIHSFIDRKLLYTKEWNRALISIPIVLDSFEKKLFVHNLLEQYWTYRGRYYFLHNNCGTAANLILLSSFKEERLLAFQPSSSIEDVLSFGIKVPYMLPGQWKRKGMVYDTLEDVREMPFHFFPSFLSQVENTFSELSKVYKLDIDVKPIYRKLNFKGRLDLYKQIVDKFEDKTRVTAFFMQLDSLSRNNIIAFLKEKSSVKLKNLSKVEKQNYKVLLADTQKTVDQLSPLNYLNKVFEGKSYGVPLSSERLDKRAIDKFYSDYLGQKKINSDWTVKNILNANEYLSDYEKNYEYYLRKLAFFLK